MDKKWKFFLKEINGNSVTYRAFGIKISVKNSTYINNLKTETKNAVNIQNNYDLTPLKSAKKLILFLTPSQVKICGGVMSFYSLCEVSRELSSDSLCILSTFPNDKFTYANNDKFLNNEKIYRFSQIVDNCKNLDELIIHIPEYFAQKLYKNLSKKDIKFLKSIKNLQLNILNQNIEMMPEPKKLKKLYKLTNNITQTTAHNRYATQEACNKWQIPTHLFLALWDMSKYKKRDFSEKEKIIVLSPDLHNSKDKIIEKLKNELPDWKLITVKNMTFTEYMDLISRAFFTITFGEGFDGYFIQPAIVKSIGIAGYNDEFFPNKSWAKLDNVFESYGDMTKNIVEFIKEYSQNQQKYSKLSSLNKKMHDEIYDFEQYKDNLKRFYEKKYDFLPQKGDC